MAITEDYQVKYNQVPLSESDETYTYLDITNDTIFNKQVSNDAKIVGIKQNSQYISLLNNKKDISPLIYNYPSQISSDSYFPIIINKFAQKKYGLKVDSKFSMNINNTTDRYYKTIHDVSPSSVFNFKVVGICDTYIGEEYYVAQDVANYILGLKTHLLDQQTQIQNGPHSYYFDSTKAIQISGENLDRARTSTPSDNTGLGDGARILNDVSYFPTTTYSSMDSDHFIQRKPDGLPNYTQDSEGNFDPNPGVKYDVNNLYDLNDNSDNKITNDNLTGNVTPYGFNGVFTDSKHGDYLVNNCAYIYAPSGIYPANDKFSNDTLTTLFKYGANAQIVSQILGL
jgi:putative ABC transport system permease protein